MKQSLINIIQNAIDAVSENGSVEISYAINQKDFVINVSDTGTGISDEMKKKIFDLYFTTKKEGNGLGLSIAQKIVTQHGGTIDVISQLNKGTTFRINIPQ
jgi:signal transduction histidine kinase